MLFGKTRRRRETAPQFVCPTRSPRTFRILRQAALSRVPMPTCVGRLAVADKHEKKPAAGTSATGLAQWRFSGTPRFTGRRHPPGQTTPEWCADAHFFDNVGSRGKRRCSAADDETDAGWQRRPVQAERMVREKIDAALEATAGLMAGASSKSIVHHYRKRVATNAKRLSKLHSSRDQKSAPKVVFASDCQSALNFGLEVTLMHFSRW